MSLVIMEDDRGIGVQVAGDHENVVAAFSNLVGKPEEARRRATLVTIDYRAGGIEYQSKDLPVLPCPDNESWGYRLGEGEIPEPDSESGGE
jgi:hypothetical protein